MWWNNVGWDPMNGLWIMPFFGLMCIFIFMYFISKIFKSEEKWDELLFEIQALRREVDSLRKSKKEDMITLVKGTNTK